MEVGSKKKPQANQNQNDKRTKNSQYKIGPKEQRHTTAGKKIG